VKVRTLHWVEEVLSRVDGLLVAARWDGASGSEWRGAVIDSRLECSGRLFFAIRGEATDGHRYVENAYAAGSVAAVVETDALASGSIPHVVVRSSAEALQELARAYRAHLEAKVIAVTGSAGKTTTKEFIRAAIRTKYRVHCNPGNYNSLLGVPLTVLETEEDSEYLVSEVGANRTGEVGFLADMIRPQIGVITNVGDAHVGYFGSRDAIAAAKGELLDHVDTSGIALLPRDDDYFDELRERARCKILSFGTRDADFALSKLDQEGRRVSFDVNQVRVTINALGRYNAMNACAAFAVGEVCGVEPARIREALESVSPMPGRGRIQERGGVVVVDESYNASPASMALSLEMLCGLSGVRRRIAVLGDMKELGDESSASHERVGRHAASLPIDELWWVGAEADHVARGLGDAVSFSRFADVAAAVEAAKARVAPGDAVLVKASRVCELDRFVKELLRHLDEGMSG
jgi:UDP-N-acetylmuramoyl-tripeptide--D-alanyl-D-alanine ligase